MIMIDVYELYTNKHQIFDLLNDQFFILQIVILILLHWIIQLVIFPADI